VRRLSTPLFFKRITMQKVLLGSTGLQVSALAMGTIQITRLGWKESVGLVREVVDLGIDLFDTAPVYFDSEKRLGDALRGIRDKVTLITKSNRKDAKGIREHIEESLTNLRTDYLDVFLFHNLSALGADNFAEPGGPLEAVLEAQEQGKIRYLGYSSHSYERAVKALSYDELRVAMVPANYISRDYLEDDFYQKVQQKNVAFLAMKPLGGGRMRDARACLNFLKPFKGVIPCVGIEKVEEMIENIRIWESGDELAEQDLEVLKEYKEQLGDKFCRMCGYCLPCPEGIPITTVNFIKVFSYQMPREKVLTEKNANAVETARSCTECKQCRARCPYDLDIPAMLKDNIAFYESFARQ
jgi:predicted aldo/keto reductase-like oxidoreductase